MTTRTAIVVAVLLMALFLSACGSPNPQPAGLTPIPSLAPGATVTLVPAIQAASAPTAAASTSTQANAAVGDQIFVTHCSSCHGPRGEGVDAPALRNNVFIQNANDQAVFTTIAGGRPGTAMPAWLQANGGPLDNTQINNVVAFLRKIQKVEPLPTATLAPTTTPAPSAPSSGAPEPARPSAAGGPGPAVNLKGDSARGKGLFGTDCAGCHGPEGVLGVPNPDSDDGSVPTLNPIDPTVANKDPKVFATNIDLFVEHGSVPAGPAPEVVMPSFGDLKLLTDQQIADLIAYVMSLNGVSQ